MRLFHLLVEARFVIDELERKLVAHVLDGGGRLGGSEELISVRNIEFFGNSAWREVS
jgi:hypothetical protein